MSGQVSFYEKAGRTIIRRKAKDGGLWSTGAPSTLKGKWLSDIIVKLMCVLHISGLPHKGKPLGGLSRHEGKLSCTVLRGLGAGDSPWLPGCAKRSLVLLAGCKSLSDKA